MGGTVKLGLRSTRSAALSAAVSPSEDILGQIRQVAETHKPEGGYGDTFWNAGTKTVYWVSADWTSNEEYDAAYEAFGAIDGVENVEGESEAYGPEGDDWEQVWPEPSSDLAVHRLVELASLPLPEEKPMTAFVRIRPDVTELHVRGFPAVVEETIRQATPEDFARWRDHQWEGS